MMLRFQFISILPMLLCLAAAAYAQKKVIVDTDIDSDVDDVHALEKKGAIEILGIIVTSDDTHAACCVDVLNTYFGRSNLPIGFLKEQSQLGEFSKYTKVLSATYPHDLPKNHAYVRLKEGIFSNAIARHLDDLVIELND